MEIPAWALAGAIAAFSGLVAYLQPFTDPEKEVRWNWRVASTKLTTATFVGLLTFWLIASRAPSMGSLVYFCYAMAGWGGAETIQFFQEVFRATIRKAAALAAPEQTDGEGKANP